MIKEKAKIIIEAKLQGDLAKECVKNFRVEEDARIYRQVYIFGYGNMRTLLSLDFY